MIRTPPLSLCPRFAALRLCRLARLALALLAALLWLLSAATAGLAAMENAGGGNGPEVVLRGTDGAALLTLRPAAALEFDGLSLRGRFALNPTPLESPWIKGVLTGEAQARLEGDRVVFTGLRLRMDAARLLPQQTAAVSQEIKAAPQTSAVAAPETGAASRKTEGAIADLLLTGDGVWLSASGELRLEQVRLEVGSAGARTVVLTGSLTWSEAQGLDANFTLEAADGGEAVALLAAMYPNSLQGLELRGPLRLGLGFVARGADQGQAEEMRFGLEIKRALALTLSGVALKLPPLQAALALHPGAGGQWDATGRVNVRGKLAPGGVELSSPSLDFDVGMSGGVYRLRRLRLASADGLALAGRKVPLASATLSGEIRPLPDNGWGLDALRLELPGGVFTAAGAVEGNGTGQGAFQAQGLDLAQLGPALATLAGLENWTAEGRLDVSGQVDADADTVRSDVRLRLRGLNYMSADGMNMGQGLEGSLRLRSRLSLTTLQRWVNADLRLDKGESLFGATYLNLVEHPLRFSANADQTGAERFQNLKARLDFSGFGALRAEGDLWARGAFEDWRYHGKAEAQDVDLGAVFAAFVAAPNGLTRWQGPDAGLGGTGSAALTVSADGKTADLQGRLTLTDAFLRSDTGDVDLRGAYLDLPLAYRIKGPVRSPEREDIPEGALGSLRIARLRSPWSVRENLAVRMALVPNRFYLLDPIRIPLFGGRIRLANLQCDAPLSREFQLSLDAGFKDIDLSQWSREGVPLQGVLGGDLGRITATRKRVSIPGAVAGDFFGGAVRADRFFMDWPLEGRRQFGASASVRGLDMERLSTALGIGRVTGLLDLDLRELLFAYGQPAGFTLTAETAGQDDFEKSISLKAVNSLSVIGTGSGIGDMGVGLFASFFEEFSYSRIGFQCILNNDRFQVRGLIREGGVEYLIKKPFLTGINVVNGNPENYISFSDMLERIQRVVKGSASSAPPSGMP